MKMNQRVFVAALGLLLGCAVLVLLYLFMSTRIDTSSIDYIKSMQKGPNEFMDLSGDIKVSSAEDIGYLVNSNYNITIYYGQQVIEMNKKCFESDTYRQKLNSIGIKVYTHVNDDETVIYKVTYWEEPVVEYSRVN